MTMMDYWKACGLDDGSRLVLSWDDLQYVLSEIDQAVYFLDEEEQGLLGCDYPELDVRSAVHCLRKAITIVCERLGIAEDYMYPPADDGVDVSDPRWSLHGAREFACAARKAAMP